MTPIRAHPDPALRAVVRARRPLLYTDGPDPGADLPGYVRAGSGLAWWRGRLAVAQDDVHAVGLVDPAEGARVDALLLPPGPGGARVFGDDRETKRLKLDLEAVLAVPDVGGETLLLFGSGSLPRRECVAVVRPGEAPEIVHAGALYAALRACTAFSGSEMNVEGAALIGGRVRLFNRGNGAPRGRLGPVNAHADLALGDLLAYLAASDRHSPPALEGLTGYALGSLGGIALGITGATTAPDGRVVLALAAEDSPDATRDGVVTGAAVGVVTGGVLRWAPLSLLDRTPVLDKAEGVALAAGLPGRTFLVTDPDDDGRPADLLTVELVGPW